MAVINGVIWSSVYFLVIFMQCLTLVSGQQGTNVALTSNGATCSATQANCDRVLDGVPQSSSNIYRWGFFADPVGTWIKITFNNQYQVSLVRFMQLYYASEKNFKTLKLTFSDGSSTEVTLSTPVDEYIWDTFAITPVTTTSVDILGTAGYQTGINFSGFQEIEIYNGTVPTTSSTSSTTSTTTMTTTTKPTTTTTTTTPTTMTTTTPTTTTTTTPTTTTTTSTTTTTTPSTTTATPSTTTTKPTTTTTTSTAAATTTTKPTTTSTTNPTTTITTTTSSTQPTTTTTSSTTTTTTAPTTTVTTQPTTTTTKPTTTTMASTTTSQSTVSQSTTSSSSSSSTTSTTTTASATSGVVGTTVSGLSTERIATYAILGAIGLIILAAVFMLCFVFLCRGNRKKKQKEKDLEKPISNGTLTMPRPKSLDYSHTYENEVRPISYDEPDAMPSRAIPVPQLAEVIIRLSDDDGFGEEFREIPSGETAKVTSAKRKSVLKKNRFNNIFPFDNNRVKLSLVDDVDDSDYINASYMHGYKNRKAYIAAQGPTKWALGDFWRMTWEQDSPIIVMLTNLTEKGRSKCDKYWPDEDGTFGIIKVKMTHEDIMPQYTIRQFEMTRRSETKVVKQFHFTVWPDEGVPDTGTDVLAMLSRVNKEPVEGRGPIVIHCSAGVGRTGTYIALDYLQLEAAEKHEVDIFKCIHLLRADRMNTIQSLAQYRFIYLTLLEALECKYVSTPCEQFNKILPLIKGQQENEEITVLEKQYKILDVYKPRKWRESCTEALKEQNTNKNRDQNILPNELMRPLLSGIEGRSDYICATFTKGYKKPFAHLVTQMPLEDTVTEFWRLVMNYTVQGIVMLNPLGEEHPYWPQSDNEMDVSGVFNIKKRRFTEGDIDVIDIHICYAGDESDEMLVKIFQMKAWPDEEKFPPHQLLLDMYHRVSDWIRKNTDSKMLVHCMNGCDRSGLFLAVHFIVEKINNEQEVDVFNAVKQMRQSRPELIPTVEQYDYLYSVAQTYLELFDTYSNFKSVDMVPDEEEDDDYMDVMPSTPLEEIPEEEEEEETEPPTEDAGHDEPDRSEAPVVAPLIIADPSPPPSEHDDKEDQQDDASIHHLIIEVL